MLFTGSAHAVEDDFDAVKKAAEQGDALSQYSLGFMYARGNGVPEDDAEAARWYRHAAEQGHAAAQFLLGIMYHNGSRRDTEQCRCTARPPNRDGASHGFHVQQW